MHGFKISHCGDLNENGNFKEGILVMQGYKQLHGRDLNENDNFEDRQLVLQGRKSVYVGDLNEIINFIQGNQTSHAWLQTFACGDINENEIVKKGTYSF